MSRQNGKDRRQASDRRQNSDRRRPNEGRYAVIEVCRSMLHLALVVRSNGTDAAGDRVVTRSIRWRKEATSLHTEHGTKELSEAFRKLVSEERLAGAKLRIALGGEYCVTRVITGPTEEVRREFAELEERSMRYLTLGPGPKALAGCTHQLDARHQHALLAVANQRTLDHLMQIADAAGLQIEAIEPSLVALSRVQAKLRDAYTQAAIIIQLDEDGAELGICHSGRMLLEYLPGGQTNAENVAALVEQHQSRLQRYIERYHSYLDAPLCRVYLAGDAEAVARARKKFKELPNFEVHLLEPANIEMPWKHAADMPGINFAAALGTATAIYSESTENQGPNLIESALAQLREPMRPVLMRSLAPIAAVVLIAITLFALHLKKWHECHSIRTELEELSPVCARATELRLQIGAAENKLGQLAALEQKLPQRNWEKMLSNLSQSMPDDVWLDRLAVHDGTAASLSGASYSDGGVYDFVNYLKQAPGVSEIALEGTGVGQSATGPTTNFTLQLVLANLTDRGEQEAHHD